MIKLFTHDDLDGIGCVVLAKLAFPENLEYECCNYDNIYQKVKDFVDQGAGADRCFLTDISIPVSLAETINDKFSHFLLFDHHKTALPLTQYSWCEVKEKNKDGILTSGTELFYRYLITHNRLVKTESLDRFVTIVRDWDTWRWSQQGEDGKICKQVNDLFGWDGPESSIQKYLKWIRNGVFPDFSEKDQMTLSLLQREVDQEIKIKEKQMIRMEIQNHPAGIVFAEKYVSEMGNRLNELHPELDLIVLINMPKHSISYRTIHDSVDVGKIAFHYGGGGHPKSAGSSFAEYQIKDFINGLLSLS